MTYPSAPLVATGMEFATSPLALPTVTGMEFATSPSVLLSATGMDFATYPFGLQRVIHQQLGTYPLAQFTNRMDSKTYPCEQLVAGPRTVETCPSGQPITPKASMTCPCARKLKGFQSSGTSPLLLLEIGRGPT